MLRPMTGRFLETILWLGCNFLGLQARHELNYRSIQLSQQAGARDRKTVLQQALVFDARARELMKDHWLKLRGSWVWSFWFVKSLRLTALLNLVISEIAPLRGRNPSHTFRGD